MPPARLTSLRWRLTWALLGGLPIIVIAVAACFVLHRYLMVRDHLGKWHVAMSDEIRNTVLAEGTWTLQATAITAKWSWNYPFVTYTASVDQGLCYLSPTLEGVLALKSLGVREGPTVLTTPGMYVDALQCGVVDWNQRGGDTRVDVDWETLTGKGTFQVRAPQHLGEYMGIRITFSR